MDTFMRDVVIGHILMPIYLKLQPELAAEDLCLLTWMNLDDEALKNCEKHNVKFF